MKRLVRAMMMITVGLAAGVFTGLRPAGLRPGGGRAEVEKPRRER